LLGFIHTGGVEFAAASNSLNTGTILPAPTLLASQGLLAHRFPAPSRLVWLRSGTAAVAGGVFEFPLTGQRRLIRFSTAARVTAWCHRFRPGRYIYYLGDFIDIGPPRWSIRFALFFFIWLSR